MRQGASGGSSGRGSSSRKHRPKAASDETAIGRDPEVRTWRLEREANAAGAEDLA